jgi:hypothetical protein
MDKPDAVIKLTRTDQGVKLTTTHRRTSAYPSERSLSIDGLDGDAPVTYRTTHSSWPNGTTPAAELLDELQVPLEFGRDKVRRLLDDQRATAGDPERFKVRNDALTAAIRYRRIQHANTLGELA